MKKIALFVFLAMLAGGAMSFDEFDFKSSWKKYDEAVAKQLPRTATNILARIESAAVTAERWPDAIKAFAQRLDTERQLNDDLRDKWITEFERRIASAPEGMRPYLDLYLAHVYAENSRPWRWGGSSPTKLTDDAATEKLPAWSPERLPASVEALFARVLASADLLKSEPVANWKDVIPRGNMPDACRPTLYDLAIHDMIDFYGSTIPDKTLEKGLALLDGLVAFHSGDGDTDALADAEYSRLQYADEFDAIPQNKRVARRIASLDSFIAKWKGKSEVAALAICDRAQIERDRDHFAEARTLAQEGAALWPKSVGGKNCLALVDSIEAPSISLETEGIWAAPLPKIRVSAANLDEVHFKLVKVPSAEFPQIMELDTWNRVRLLSKYGSRKGTMAWSIPLEHHDDYATHETEIDPPADLPPGAYILFAGADGEFKDKGLPYYALPVQVTELAIAMSSGAREIAGTVYASGPGTRIAGAKVELWGREKSGRGLTVLQTTTTDADGRFAFSAEGDDYYDSLRGNVRVVSGKDECVTKSHYAYGVRSDKEVRENISIVTDRSLYRPGQTIRFKGYAFFRDREKRDFRVLPDAEVKLELLDPNGKSVDTLKTAANAWGTFVGEFTAPRDRLTGNYEIRARFGESKAYDSTHIRVEEYKRPKFTVELGAAPSDAVLGREVEIVGTAKTYSGLPVQGAEVAWTADRATRYPGWFRWFDIGDDNGDNQVAEGATVTDEKGEFRIRFTPVADPAADLSGEPSFSFEVSADVTDTAGETRSVSCDFEIGTVAWRASIAVGGWQEAGKPVNAAVSLRSLDGAAASAKGRLVVHALNGPDAPVRKPADNENWRWGRRNQDAKGPWNWESWENGAEVKAVDAEVKDGKWEGEFVLPTGAYRVEFETTDPQGKTVHGQTSFAVIDCATERLGFAAPSHFVAECSDNTVKVGTHLRYLWASGYATGCGRMEVFSNGRRVLVKDSDPDKPFLLMDYEVREEDRGEVECRLTFLREGRLYAERAVTNVAWDNKLLAIEREHFVSNLETGKPETWTFKVSGPGEVLAFMYDRSLDAYAYHDIATPFGDLSPLGAYLPSSTLANGIERLADIGGSFPRRRNAEEPCWREIGYLFRILMSNRYWGFMASGARRMKQMAVSNAAIAYSAATVDAEVHFCEASPDGLVFCEGEQPKEEPEVKVRSDLAETAFFMPQLETDKDGRVTLSFTAPEAITGWKLLMLAHDKELKCGILRDDTITTTRPLMVEPNPPRFVREGDDFRFAVKVTNNTDEPQEARVSLAFGDLESGAPAPVGGGTETVALAAHETRAVEFAVNIPDGQGFLRFVAKAVGAKFTDGEEGALAVLSRRVEVREAVQLNLRGAGEKRFALTNLVESAKNGDTIRSIDLTVRVVSRPAWYAVASLPYLMEFPHECCEQTFSRYYANALGEWIASADPRIRETFDAWKMAGADALKSPLELNEDLKQIALDSTPWVRDAADETAAKQRLGELFDAKRMAQEHKRCLEKLEDAITDSGLFPWFPGGSGSEGISFYILVGFARLEHLCGTKQPDYVREVCRTLDRLEREDVEERLRLAKTKGIEFHVNGYDVRWLYLHSFKGVQKADADTVKTLKKHLCDEWTDFGVESQALAALALARGGERNTALAILESLKERAVVSEEFGMYWKRSPFFSSSVFAAPVSMQAAVVEAFREITKDQAAVDACNVWILKQKQTQNWSSTASTVDAIYALLYGGGTDLLAGDTVATVTLGGGEVPRQDVEEGTGAYTAHYRGGEVKPEMGEIVLRSDAPKGVVWGGVNWTYLEDAMKVRAFEPKELRIEKQYFKRIRTPDGERLQPIAGVLEQGDEIVARLRLRCDRSLEYVHIRDERPSCAEPVDVLSGYRWQDGVGYYQSTRDTATHYYLDRLNKGEFVLETSYRVQQRGVFTGGLAQIQCMYAPEFTAHSTAERVEVK